MTNPFEDRNGSYFVLINDEGQHSLWPVFADVPAGWRIARQADTYAESLNYIDGAWTGMRPTAPGRPASGGKPIKEPES